MLSIRYRVVVGVTCAATLAALTGQGNASSSRPTFNPPVLLTVEKEAGGYEPGVVVDQFNNVFVTAHKANATLVVSPDSKSPTKIRSQSWLWTSKDGKTFSNMPGLTPVQEQNAEFGDEGDLATDATGHLYFVDTNVADNSFSRYKATGNGQLALESTRPIGPFGEPVDDRPWIAAHGDGVVMYLGNQGTKDSYPAGRPGDGDAYGPGRYTAYMSYNHGDTFDPLGITLSDSGWCRPAADHRKGSKLLYVLCTNDGGANDETQHAGDPGFDKGTLWSYVSKDDGKTWSRFKMGGYDAKDRISTYPSVSVAKDGTVYALYNDSQTDDSGNPTEGNLRLLTSKDAGKTWTDRSITPEPGIYQYTWIDVAPDGTLGIGYYYRPDRTSDWHVWAATSRDGRHFAAAQVAEQPIARRSLGQPPGDFFQVAFGPDSKLNVVWTSALIPDLAHPVGNSDIYYAKQK